MKGDWNKHNVEIGDMFFLSYHGINVFFCVGTTDYDAVYIYEVGTRKIKTEESSADVIASRLRPARDPLVVLKKYNSWTKADYYVKTGIDEEGTYIVVNIKYGSKLFLKAQNEYGITYPDYGDYRVYKIDFKGNSPYKFYWDCAEKKKNEEKIAEA